jgi:hypothetical protein
MEEGRLEDAGDIGGEERPVAWLRGAPFVCGSCTAASVFAIGGGGASMGESGGGGMSVPSVKE